VKRLKILILVFCIALSIPLAYFVLRTYWSLEQEERGELRYFAVTLFDQMEEELAALIVEEESRPIDHYTYTFSLSNQVPGSGSVSPSPLSQPPKQRYILGYMQNNPDGSFQTPMAAADETASYYRPSVLAQLREANKIFNRERTTVPESVGVKPGEIIAKKQREKPPTFAEKYLDLSRSKRQRQSLGQEKTRVEELTPGQALNLASRGRQQMESEVGQKPDLRLEAEKDMAYKAGDEMSDEPARERGLSEKKGGQVAAPAVVSPATLPADTDKLRVEVAPMQSVFINDSEIFIFRRIVINNQIYRQGFILIVDEFLNHLVDDYFAGQPMAEFTSLHLSVKDRGRETATVKAGAMVPDPTFSLDRTFPRPFSFLRANLTCRLIPKSVGRRTLNFMLFVLALVILMGLFAIYQSARAVVDLSERRSRFVSSVTHELKTPLTNIRMYIEMLEQGIARDHEREQDYFRILGSESSRLSRLINNVLEFSKLEKKQRHLQLQEGTFEEVIAEVKEVMQEKLRQEGFNLQVKKEEVRPFKYDREAMIQVLINLIDNSIKFGKASPSREISIRVWTEGAAVKIGLSDTGPGIPRHALKKVFEDFYRVDNDLTRTTGGTGIGLALVRKLVEAMGGSVTARNNPESGCTITISLPAKNA
jgi:signal transduction histidine kinase